MRWKKCLMTTYQFAKTQLQEETTKVNLLLLFRELKWKLIIKT